MRYLLAIAVLCATVSHGAEVGRYVPTIAAAAGFASAATPTPLPTPAPGNICPDCNGKGWNGDGTVRNKCEACDGTGKRTTTATDTAVGQLAEVHEVPPPASSTKLVMPAVFTDYSAAALEATSSRELLVLLHPAGQNIEPSRTALASLEAAHRYVWLFVPADQLIDGKQARDYFGADRDFRLIRHNVVTGANRIVYQPSDLEN